MTEQQSERIIIPMPRSLVEQIDSHRFAGHFPSRAEAVRSLLMKSLAGSSGARPDAVTAPTRAVEAPEPERAPAASTASLKDLLADFFAESPKHRAEFGYDDSTSAEHAVANEFASPNKDDPFDPAYISFIPATAAKQIEMIADFNSPAAVALREMLGTLCTGNDIKS